jgi:pimeloyl-ACP methyl ester carboxylesterase
MRACQPASDGYVERDGVRFYYEVYGSGEPTVLLLPTWSIIHSRHWKMQIPYLARYCRVVTFDGRGNGRSDRPAVGYDEREFAADALAVMDATGTGRAVIVSLSLGAQRALLLAAGHPDRVTGAVFIGPAVPLAAPPGDRPSHPWDEKLGTDEGWAKYNRHYWLRDYRGFLEFFFSQMFTEPHSTKPGRGLRRLGSGDDCRDPHRGGSRWARREDRARAVQPRPLPGAGDPGHRRRDHWQGLWDSARRGHRRPACPARGLGPRPACA